MSAMYDVDLAGLTRSYRLQFLDHLESGVRRSIIGFCKTLADPHRDFNDRSEAVEAVLIEAKRLRNAPQAPMADEDDDRDALLASLARLEGMVEGIHYLMTLMPEQHDQLQAVYDALEHMNKPQRTNKGAK